ncbi:MAG: polyphenol oxidase family protein [Myxococcota bacterium]|nr:polyphenol oxidase family protein [Myxococcota bacterium]
MPLLRSELLADAGFDHAFPTRDCDDASVLSALRCDEIVQAKQVHGARAVEAIAAAGNEADAVIGRHRLGGVRTVVGVRVADCVPILLASEESGDVAAIHAGWRGVVAGVIQAAVELARGRSLIAAVGPSIGPCCFVVGIEVAELIARASGGAPVLVRADGGKAYVDLRAAVRAQLRAAMVRDERIEDVSGCTKHDVERFHSYRRDGPASGRMLAAIATR